MIGGPMSHNSTLITRWIFTCLSSWYRQVELFTQRYDNIFNTQSGYLQQDNVLVDYPRTRLCCRNCCRQPALIMNREKDGFSGHVSFLLGPPLRKNKLHKRERSCFRGSILPPLCTKTSPRKRSEKCSDAPHIPSSTKTFRGFRWNAKTRANPQK